MKTRLIVFFLTATQCIFFVGCASRNAPQRREQQNPFPSEQPFSNPTRTDTERNIDNDRNNRDTNNDNDRNNRDTNDDNDRNNRDTNDDNDRNNRDGDNDRDNRNRDNNGGGEYRNRQKKYGAPGWHSHRVNVTTSEMTFRLSQSDIPAGNIDFIVTNAGKIAHEMSVIKANFPANQLPVTRNGLLDHQKVGEKVGEINAQELKGRATKVLSLNLTPGKYLIVSHPPGQLQGVMKAIFVVK